MSPVAQFPIQPQKDDKTNLWQYDSEDFWNGFPYSWQDGLYPRSRSPAQGMGAIGAVLGPSDVVASMYTMWWWSVRPGGATERWQMFGQCLDQSSNVVANATVTMYDQTLGVQIDQQNSDNGGNYKVGSPYGSGRGFVVAYKPGSPDIAGTSQDNLP